MCGTSVKQTSALFIDINNHQKKKKKREEKLCDIQCHGNTHPKKEREKKKREKSEPGF